MGCVGVADELERAKVSMCPQAGVPQDPSPDRGKRSGATWVAFQQEMRILRPPHMLS